MKNKQLSQTNGQLAQIPHVVYTRPETAVYLRIGLRTLDGLVDTNQIKHFNIGKAIRFRLRDINQFIENALPQIETDRQRIISSLLDKIIQLEDKIKELEDKNSTIAVSLPTANSNIQKMLKEAEWWIDQR